MMSLQQITDEYISLHNTYKKCIHMIDLMIRRDPINSIQEVLQATLDKIIRRQQELIQMSMEYI